jgi:hypothetical protein
MERELDKEVAFHLERQVQDLIATGMAPAEARRQATLLLGGLEQTKEACRDARGTRWLEDFFADCRYGMRVLRRSPAFTCAAVASLALGIGANTAIFQLIDAVRLRTLPLKNPQELAQLRISNVRELRGSTNSAYAAATYSIWERIRDQQQAFSGVFAWSDYDFNLAQRGEARVARGILVSGEFFRVLGVQPLLGRVFSAEDDRRGCGYRGQSSVTRSGSASSAARRAGRLRWTTIPWR